MSVPLAYLTVVLIWSTTPLALSWSGQDLGVLFGANARMAIGLLVCVIALLLWRHPLRWDKQSVKAYMSIALGILFAMLSVYIGSQFIASGMIAVIFGLTPIFTGLFAVRIIPGHRILPFQVFAMLLGLFGLIIIFHDQIRVDDLYGLLGVSCVLFATMLHGLSTVLSKKYASNMSALTGTTGGLILAVPVYMAVWLALGDSFSVEKLGYKTGLSILYLGIFGSAVGFMAYFYALRRVDAMKMALIPLITPVFALMIGYSFNNELPSSSMLMGAGLILGGLLVFQWGNRLPRFVTQKIRNIS